MDNDNRTGECKIHAAHCTFACEPDNVLRQIIGEDTMLSDIFSPEKIDASQKLIDDARSIFFIAARDDMDLVHAAVTGRDFSKGQAELYGKIFQPLCNIKGQAEIFGFSLIVYICKQMIDYSEEIAQQPKLSARDILIITKLAKALQRSFRDKIAGSGGSIEKELTAIMGMIKE